MPQHTSDAPSYDLYKGQYARVIIDRKSIHLGRYGSEKSRAKYKRLIAERTVGQAVGEPTADLGPRVVGRQPGEVRPLVRCSASMGDQSSYTLI